MNLGLLQATLFVSAGVDSEEFPKARNTMHSLLDHPLISSRYFFPRPDAPIHPFSVDVEGATLACARYEMHPGAPWLVHFHGNGEVVADWEHEYLPHFRAAGLNVFFAEYRGYGASTGTPGMITMLGDVPPVLAAVGTKPENMVVYGRSVGSIFAVESAYRTPNLGGLVIESGIASPIERILMRVRPEEIGAELAEMMHEAEKHLDHQKKLGAFPGRTLVLHAKHDSMVQRSHAERNAAWAKKSALVLYEHGDHNDVTGVNLDDIVSRVVRFVRGG